MTGTGYKVTELGTLANKTTAIGTQGNQVHFLRNFWKIENYGYFHCDFLHYYI